MASFDGFGTRAGALFHDVRRSRYHLSPMPEARPMDFHRPDHDASGWGTVAVPGIRQAQGQGGSVSVGSGYLTIGADR